MSLLDEARMPSLADKIRAEAEKAEKEKEEVIQEEAKLKLTVKKGRKITNKKK